MATWVVVEEHPNGTPIRILFGESSEWSNAEIRHHEQFGDRDTVVFHFDLEEGDTTEAVLERFFGSDGL